MNNPILSNHPGLCDANVADFPRLDGETGDSARIMRAVAAAGERGVVLFPRGEYEIDEMLVIKSGVSLLMHKSARLVATREMPYVLKYFGGRCEPENCGFGEDRSQFIKGGEIDGRGLASCAHVMGVKHITLSGTNFRNGKGIGLKLGDCDLPRETSGGYEIMASNLYFHCDMKGLGVNTAIVNMISDSHFTDVVMVNYTYGLQTWGGCNRFTRFHFWGWKERVLKSVAFDIWALDAVLSECYADTAETGFWIHGDTTMTNCTSCNHPDCPMDNPVSIRHDAGSLIVTGSRFSKNGPKQTVYVRGEKAGELIWRDNIVRSMAGNATAFTDDELATLRATVANNAGGIPLVTSTNVATASTATRREARLSQTNAKRRERLMAWYAPARFGIFYHYGLFTGGGCATSGEKYRSPLAHATVEAFEAATPDPRIVARNLAAAAKDCGARYATLTVFHSCGGQTVLFPTKRPEFLHRTRRDYIRPFLEECRAAGIMPMLYIPCDCHNWDNPQTGPNMPEEIGRDTTLYAKAFEAIIEELHERYGDLPAGFWLDGGVPPTCFGAAALLHRLWPNAVVVGNGADAFDCPDVDCGTSECLDESVKPDPPYDRPGGYLKLHAWGSTLPRTDFNEDIPTPNDWWFHGDAAGIAAEYADDRFFLLHQMICAIGRRGQWNFHPGIGPRIDGTVADNLVPQLAAIRDFLSWAGEAVYGTTGPEGSFVRSGWINVCHSLSFCAVTRRLDDPSVFYAIFTEKPSQWFVMLDTMGREPRRATDLRTGRELPFEMWSGPVFKDGPWNDIAEHGAAVVKLEF